jgi:hypothetical protein
MRMGKQSINALIESNLLMKPLTPKTSLMKMVVHVGKEMQRMLMTLIQMITQIKGKLINSNQPLLPQNNYQRKKMWHRRHKNYSKIKDKIGLKKEVTLSKSMS